MTNMMKKLNKKYLPIQRPQKIDNCEAHIHIFVVTDLKRINFEENLMM